MLSSEFLRRRKRDFLPRASIVRSLHVKAAEAIWDRHRDEIFFL
jgi:hypothetical protein